MCIRDSWDIHNHILPGVDDGSGSMTETLRLVQLEHDQGVRNLVFTPHYRKGMFEISLDDKEEVFHRTCETLVDHFPDMKFYLGCEYFASPHTVSYTHLMSKVRIDIPMFIV